MSAAKLLVLFADGDCSALRNQCEQTGEHCIFPTPCHVGSGHGGSVQHLESCKFIPAERLHCCFCGKILFQLQENAARLLAMVLSVPLIRPRIMLQIEIFATLANFC